MPRLVAPGCRFDHLAPHPGGGGVRGDVHMHQFPATVRDEDQGVERLERECLHSEQIRCPQVVGVVGQERAPGLARRVRRAALSVALDRALGDHQPELQQFAADPLAAPARIVLGHRGDQLAHLGTEPWAADRPACAPAPDELPDLAVPADDALGSDQDQVPAPVTVESADHNPEQLVAGAQPRSLPGRPRQYRELMTQQEILGDQRLAVAHGHTDEAEEEKQILEHRPNIMPLNARSRPGRLLHPHRPRSIGGFRFGSEGATLGVMTDPKLLARLRSFRQELYDDLGLRQDSLFELVDAVLTAPKRRTLVRLSLCPCFRRRWPSTCDALADGTLDVGGLRALFQTCVPLPGPGERRLWVVDGTHWPRPATATSPARTWEHRPLPGKPQQGVVPAWAYHWLVQVPEVAGSWVLPLDVQRRGPTAGTPTQMAIRQIAQARAGQAPQALRPVVALDSAHDVRS